MYDQGAHVFAFEESADTSNALTDTDAALDGWAPRNTDNHILLPQDMMLTHAIAFGATITQARIVLPSFRRISLPSITPLQVSATPGDLPAVARYSGYEPVLSALDDLAVEWAENAAGAEQAVIGLFCKTMGAKPAPRGPSFTVRCTAANTTGNLLWGEASLVFVQGLPPGRYAVIGMACVGTNLLLARLRFPNQGPMPGCIAQQANGDIPWPDFRMGNNGLFGEFEHTAPPLLQVFGVGAPTTQEVFLDLVKIR